MSNRYEETSSFTPVVRPKNPRLIIVALRVEHSEIAATTLRRCFGDDHEVVPFFPRFYALKIGDSLAVDIVTIKFEDFMDKEDVYRKLFIPGVRTAIYLATSGEWNVTAYQGAPAKRPKAIAKQFKQLFEKITETVGEQAKFVEIENEEARKRRVLAAIEQEINFYCQIGYFEQDQRNAYNEWIDEFNKEIGFRARYLSNFLWHNMNPCGEQTCQALIHRYHSQIIAGLLNFGSYMEYELMYLKQLAASSKEFSIESIRLCDSWRKLVLAQSASGDEPYIFIYCCLSYWHGDVRRVFAVDQALGTDGRPAGPVLVTLRLQGSLVLVFSLKLHGKRVTKGILGTLVRMKEILRVGFKAIINPSQTKEEVEAVRQNLKARCALVLNDK